MKYILKPTLQTILAIILTIIWGVPTLIYSILYFILMSIWEFKLCFYKPLTFKIDCCEESISELLLWSKDNFTYDSYFHCIWNLQSNKPVMVQITQKISNKLNLN